MPRGTAAMNSSLAARDGLAEVEDVRALRHHHADAESRLPALAHEVVGRILEAARDGRDVAEPEGAARRLDRRLGDGPRAVERAGDAERDALGAGLDRAGRNNGVLPLQANRTAPEAGCPVSRAWRG